MLRFYFNWILWCFKLPYQFLLWPNCLWAMHCLVSMSLHIFSGFDRFWYTFFHVGHIAHMSNFSFLCLLRLDFILINGQWWGQLLELLRRTYILYCLVRMFCKYVRPVWFILLFNGRVSLYKFFHMTCLIFKSGYIPEREGMTKESHIKIIWLGFAYSFVALVYVHHEKRNFGKKASMELRVHYLITSPVGRCSGPGICF